MAPHTLFYSPGACSLAPHIALRDARLPFELAKVDLRARDTDWLALNPKGYVPALRLPDGEVLTETAVILGYIADQRPDAQLAPATGTLERYRLQEWLSYVATELHKGMSPIYSPMAGSDYKKHVIEQVARRLDHVARVLVDRPYLLGERYSIADAYAFYALYRWTLLKQDVARWPELADYQRRLAARPTIAAALEVEGITL